MKTFLFLINLLWVSTLLYGAPEPTINITHGCNGKPAYISYSYEGEEYQIQWSVNGGSEMVMRPGAGVIENARPGKYEIYLLIPGKREYQRYGPYYYNVYDITPSFTSTQQNNCNGITGDAEVTITLGTMHPGVSYTAYLKNPGGQVLLATNMTTTSHTFKNLPTGNYLVEIRANGKACSYTQMLSVQDEADCPKRPTIEIQHGCNGELGRIHYSYTGEEYQIQWAMVGGEPRVMEPGPGVINDVKPGKYEIYLLIPGRTGYVYHGPFYYTVYDITPYFNWTQQNTCNGITGDVAITLNLTNIQPGVVYTANLKDPNGMVLQSSTVTGGSHTFTGIASGNYLLDVQANGRTCVYGQGIIIEDESFPINVTATAQTCHNLGGNMQVNIPNFQAGGNYTVTIENTSNHQVITYQQTSASHTLNNMAAGTYTVSVNNNTCTGTAQVTVEAGGAEVVTSVYKDGSTCLWRFNANMQGGAVASSYTWQFFDANNNEVTPAPIHYTSPSGNEIRLLRNNAAIVSGKLTLTTTDGCTYEYVFDVPSTKLFPLYPAQQHVLTTTKANCGSNNGSIVVDWSAMTVNPLFTITEVTYKIGGGNPIAVSVPSGATSVTIPNLAAGNYSIDFNTTSLCHTDELILNAEVLEDPFVDIQGTVRHYCPANRGGEIRITSPTTGVTYEWTDPSGNIISGANGPVLNVGAMLGSYTVKVTQNGGTCFATKYFNVGNFNFLETLTIDPLNCGTNGSIKVHSNNISGNDVPYSVTLSGNATSYTINNTPGFVNIPIHQVGNYSVTMESSSGCTKTISGLQVNDEGLDITIRGNDPCTGGNGQVSATVAGGVPPYSFKWSNGSLTQNAGTMTYNTLYSVTISDANGCTSVASRSFVSQFRIDVIQGYWYGPTCDYTGNYGGAFVVGHASGHPHQYEWKNSSGAVVGTASTLTGQPAGSYTVVVTNRFGCSATGTVHINASSNGGQMIKPEIYPRGTCGQPFGFAINYPAVTACSTLTVEIFTKGPQDATLQLYDNVTFSPTAHEYLGFLPTMDPSTAIVIRFTDCCGNSTFVYKSANDLGTFPAFSVSNVAVTPQLCDQLGGAVLTISGYPNDGPFQTTWPDGVVANSRTDLKTGTYTVLISDGNGCSSNETIHIPGHTGSPRLLNKIACNQQISLDATNITGGQAPYTVSWRLNGGAAQTTTTLNQIGSYIIEITDANGCVGTERLTIQQNIFMVNATPTAPSCDGTDGSIVLNATNTASSIVAYDWTGPSSSTYTGHSLYGLAAGTYTYVVTDANGCTKTGNVVVPPNTAIQPVFAPNCPPQINSIAGGQPPYQFVFTAQQANPTQPTYSITLDANTTYPYTLNDLDEGQYQVEVIDAHGCVAGPYAFNNLNTATPRPWSIKMQWYRQDDIPQVSDDYKDADVVKDDLSKQVQSLLDDLDQLASQGDYCKKQGDDELALSYSQSLQHYTLYYYNVKDELVRTVPPAGVDFIADGTVNELTNLLDYRAGASQTIPSKLLPEHIQVTQYNYNGLGQLVSTKTPDKGITNSFYTSKGLLRFSQDAQQQLDNTYGYTLYDELERVTEAGEISFTGTLSQADINTVGALPTGATRNEYVHTYYSEPHIVNGNPVGYYGQVTKAQRNLRNHISYTEAYPEGPTGQVVTSTYSYDVHGNVEWLRQYTQGLGENYIAYDYDLVSNVVQKVRYNEYSEDKFFHKYAYDEQKRIEKVYTSTDGIIWDNDANYDYYAHGPLKRMELGDDKVQGLDYVYTIHGWIKSVNNPLMDQYNADPGATNDPGEDGYNNVFMKDAFGYTLGYYNGDFTRGSIASVIDYDNDTRSLYNGNISAWSNGTNTNAMMNALHSFSAIDESLTQRNFTYDELHRIKTSNLLTMQSPSPLALGPNGRAYETDYSYDGNGNLQNLNRAGNGSLIDALEYSYGAGDLKNRLLAVDDARGNQGAGDLDAQQNYTYDAIGNLIRSETNDGTNTTEIMTVDWRVDGKVSQVNIANHAVQPVVNSRIQFLYDAAGNRVAKIYDADISIPNNEITTYHVRDAAGTILATYTRTSTGDLELKERTLFGSERLGNNKKGFNFGAVAEINRTNTSSLRGLKIRLLSNKVFELSDHLGNVTMTLSDQKQNTGVGYEADLLSYQQYYPFGGTMPDRSMNARDYRFGFNGKENDEEWGTQLIQDYGFRLYNPAIGRFLSVDPLAPDYPGLTTYQFASNMPIAAIDLDGLEAYLIHGTNAGPGRWTDIWIDQTRPPGEDNNFLVESLLQLTNSETVDVGFAWNILVPGRLYGQRRLNGTHNSVSDRTQAAEMLVEYIVEQHTTVEADGSHTINWDEPITLIGHSHGGNVAIQAAKLLFLEYGVTADIITIATPTMADGAGGLEDPDGGAGAEGIIHHLHIWNIIDGIQGGASGGDEDSRYNLVGDDTPGGKTQSIEVDASTIYFDHEWMDAHSMDARAPGEFMRQVNEDENSNFLIRP